MKEQKAPFLHRTALQSARLESYLSTNAFYYLFTYLYLSALFLTFLWGFHSEFYYEDHPPAMRPYIAIARGAGYTLNLNTALVILLAARLLFTFIRETPLNKILPMDSAFPDLHIIVGYLIAAAVCVHAVFHFVWLIGWNRWKWGLFSFNMSVITGILLLITFTTMFVLSLPKIRSKHFRRFQIVHITGAAIFFALLILHGMYRERPETYKWITPPLLIYIADRIVRRMRVNRTTIDLLKEGCVMKDGDILELRLPKPFDYTAGQFAEIRVPCINREWHPFTIASAPHEETTVFYIKALGDWTQQLREEFRKRIDGDVFTPLRVQVRGPYGAPCQHTSAYNRVVLVSGGVGSTPFAAICKDLQHRSVTRKAALNAENHHDHCKDVLSTVNTSKYEDRVRIAISELYDINIGGDKDQDEEEQQKTLHLANMLKLTAETDSSTDGSISTSGDDGASDDESVEGVMVPVPSMQHRITANSNLTRKGQSSIIEHLPDTKKQGRAQLYGLRARVLAFLHTTRVSFVLLVTLILRIVFVCVGSIFKSEFVRVTASAESIESGFWVVIADTVLSLVFAVVLPLTIILEISYMGWRFFRTTGRCVDFFMFLPLTIFCTAQGVRTWISGMPESPIMAFLHYIVFIPALFVLLASRMFRSIGNNQLLADKNCKCAEHNVPDVDFIWATPREEEDEWLRNELEPLASGTDLRLHRYVTRSNEVDIEKAENYISSLHAGRPEWNDIFRKVYLAAPSHSVVGVFFCGPKKMEDSVNTAMRQAEMHSNLRAAYLTATKGSVVMKDLRLPRRSVLEALKERGCSVRFVFRKENFG